jgi:aryl-alcohol dehydrogenase-like predicted oxidoreductase
VDQIQLHGTELTVSRICFGTMTFGKQVDQEGATRLIDECLASGINFIDTANVYQTGLSEQMLGLALGSRRSKIVLASKVRGTMGPGPDEAGLSKQAIMRAVEDSLKRLRTDYLDIYYLHLPDQNVPIEESLAAMDNLVQQGKVRYPASSNYASWQVVQQLWIAKENGYRPALITQPMYNLLARGIEQEYLPMAKQFGVSSFVYNPLAGGMLTGKQKADAPVPGTRFDNNKMYLDRYWHPAYFDAVEQLGAVAAIEGRNLISLSLNWLLHHAPVSGVILGASSLEQLQQNLRHVADGPLSPSALQACDVVWSNLRGPTPQYNR